MQRVSLASLLLISADHYRAIPAVNGAQGQQYTMCVERYPGGSLEHRKSCENSNNASIE